ncbi:unnamed protein product [Moneuplotes crassus]|uniref:Uncharacterized protein n=2 Tax=Euplotes crassus TaxID=5936 RepID=A0AAD2CXU4_EUPCR|nr:unnamed protein product [Moneuplotes crassus]
MFPRSSSNDDTGIALRYNKMMSRPNFTDMPFNPILHKFNSTQAVSAAREANSKKTSWKSRNFLKVKINDYGGKVYDEHQVPPAIKYLNPKDICQKNTKSAYDPIKYETNHFSMPTRHRKRPEIDANHTITISDVNYRDNKAMNHYNREVSKRTKFLKNRGNKFLARYAFDKNIKHIDRQRNASIENLPKNKLSFEVEKELERGYNILSLNSQYQLPTESKARDLKRRVQGRLNLSNDNYSSSIRPSVWDQINMTGEKDKARQRIIESLKTSHSMSKENRLISKRVSYQNLKTSDSIKSNLHRSDRYCAQGMNSRANLRESLDNAPIHSYGNGSANILGKSPMSKSLASINSRK